MTTEDILASVLANEATARVLLSQLLKRGVTIKFAGIDVDSKSLSHEQVNEIVLQIYLNLKRRKNHDC